MIAMRSENPCSLSSLIRTAVSQRTLEQRLRPTMKPALALAFGNSIGCEGDSVMEPIPV